MDGEHARATDLVEGLVEGRSGGHQLAGPLGQEECGVALVEVPDRRRQPERPDGPHAADAQDELLVEAHLAAADVQDVGDRPIGVGVFRQVGIEEEDRHPADLGDPHRDRQVAIRQGDRDVERIAVGVGRPEQRQAVQVVVGIGVLLVSVGVDRLAEVALAIEQADADERQGHVAGRLHVVAGQDAQPAGVDAQRFVKAVLGAEVGDRAVQRRLVLAMEPVVGPVGHVRVQLAHDRLVLGDEVGVLEHLCPADGPLEQWDGVAIASPRGAVEAAEHHACCRMPRPPQVVGKPTQAFELGWDPERDARQRRDVDQRLHCRA